MITDGLHRCLSSSSTTSHRKDGICGDSQGMIHQDFHRCHGTFLELGNYRARQRRDRRDRVAEWLGNAGNGTEEPRLGAPIIHSKRQGWVLKTKSFFAFNPPCSNRKRECVQATRVVLLLKFINVEHPPAMKHGRKNLHRSSICSCRQYSMCKCGFAIWRYINSHHKRIQAPCFSGLGSCPTANSPMGTTGNPTHVEMLCFQVCISI